jgi:DNA-binding NarL/FixJ family response regulator
MHATDVKSIQILIIDDHILVRTCLRMLLESRQGMAVVGEASDPAEAVVAATRERPDIILLDLDLGATNGLDLLPELRRAAPEARVIVLTGVRDPDIHRRAVRLGAMGLVLKEKAAEELFQAITKVHAGEIWLDTTLVASVLGEVTRLGGGDPSDPEGMKIAALTARERQVVELVGEGIRNFAIADRLCISEATVRHHLTSIYAKLGVVDRLELVLYAFRYGLMHFPPSRRSIRVS